MSRSAIDVNAAERTTIERRPVRQAEETRRRLLEAGAAAFARDGFHATKVAAIARAAGVANGTFYLHFERKEDIASELSQIAVTDLARRMSEVHEGTADPERANRAEVEALVEFVLANRSLVVALLSTDEADRGGMADLLTSQREAEIRAGQAAGTYTGAVDPEIAARAEVSMLAGVLRWWAQSEFAIERERVVEALAGLRRFGSQPREGETS